MLRCNISHNDWYKTSAGSQLGPDVELADQHGSRRLSASSSVYTSQDHRALICLRPLGTIGQEKLVLLFKSRTTEFVQKKGFTHPAKVHKIAIPFSLPDFLIFIGLPNPS